MIPDFLDPALCTRLCLTLLHSVWQVALFAAIAFIIDRVKKGRPAEQSYVIYASALAFSIAAVPATWLVSDIPDAVVVATAKTSLESPIGPAPNSIPAARIEISDTQQQVSNAGAKTEATLLRTSQNSSVDAVRQPATEARTPEPTAVSRLSWLRLAPWLAATYLTGVLLMVTRFARAIWNSQRRLRDCCPVHDGPLVDLLRRQSEKWNLKVAPMLMQTKQVVVPQVVGLMKPIILLPTSAVTRIPAEELEFILIHELAHIRRHDMWTHLLQRLAETVLFFNPTLWLLTRHISLVREFCCDDITTRTAEKPNPQLQYASALLRVAELSGTMNAEITALAASGQSPSELRRRVARLFGETLSEPLRFSRAGLVAGAVGLAMLGLVTPLWTAEAMLAEPVPVAEPAPAVPQPVEKLFRLFVADPDGRPVPHASVEFRGSPKVQEQQIRRGKFEKNGRYGTFATTDANGRLTISLTEAEVSLRISIKKPGFGPYWVGWDSADHPDPIPERITAKLEAGWSVGGIVVDASGQPVQRVSVSPNVNFKKHAGDKRQLGIGTRILTDENGAWRFDLVPKSKDPVFVSFNHEDFQALRKSLSRETFELKPGQTPAQKIELSQGLSIEGTVVDAAGKPIEGALVKTKFVNELRQGLTGAEGKYRISGCETQMSRIVVSAKGYATDMQEQMVDIGMKPVDFRMQPGGHVRIRVVDENGKGLKRARIFFKRWRGQFRYFEFSHVNQYTDDNGVWEWDEAPVDEFKADICRPNGMMLLSEPIIAREEEYVFTPPKTLVVSGQVVDAVTRKPVPKFRVVPGTRNEPNRGTKDWWSRNEGYEAKGGHYEIARNRAAPIHMFKIEAEGYKVARSRDILSTEGEIDVDFELQPAPNIAVQLMTPAGKPAAGADIAVGIAKTQIFVEQGMISDRQTYAKRAVSDGNGKFEIPSMDENFQLVITHPEGFALLKSADGPIPKIVNLREYARVEGVFKLGEKFGSGIQLSVGEAFFDSYGPDEPRISSWNRVRTDKDGSFVFERVMPGSGWIGREKYSVAGQGHPDAFSSKRVPVTFPAGKTTIVNPGGDGRKVVGRLLAPDQHTDKVLWSFASLSVEADLPHPELPKEAKDFKDDAAEMQWWKKWQKTEAGKAWIAEATKVEEEGRNLPRFSVSTDRDGRFIIDDVAPGKYLLSMYFYEHSPGSLPEFRFTVPPLQKGDIGRELDLGGLKLQAKGP